MGLRGHAAGARQDRRPDGEEGSAPGRKKATGGNYTVKRGDTLSRIAKAHGVSVSALVDAPTAVLVSNPQRAQGRRGPARSDPGCTERVRSS